MIEKSQSKKDWIPVTVFTSLFAVSFAFFSLWYDPVKLSHQAGAKEIAAVFYLFPLSCIFGTAAFLFALEKLNLIRIRRNKTMRIVLLSIIGLFLLWAAMTVAANLKNDKLLGEGVQRIIAISPNEFFPEQFTYMFSKYLFKSVGMLIYQLIAIGLFAAIGTREQNKEEVKINKVSNLIEFIPGIVFALLFILALMFYKVWYVPSSHSPDNSLVHRVAALAYFYPLCIMFGSATVLYAAELLGIVRIKRNKVVGYILLGYIILISIWVVLAFASATYKEVGLFGAEFKHIIKQFPEWLFPSWFGFRHEIISVKYTGVIVYEILGIGLFSAIGRKDT